MDLDFLCVGDALIDMFLSLSSDEHTHIDETKREICFVAGAKIPIDDCKFLLGGNACNVSVGLSRLGFKTALAAELGDDEFGKKITSGVEKENVIKDFIKIIPGKESSFSLDIAFMKDRTIFSRHIKGAHDFAVEEPKAQWVYLTSLGEEWEPLYEKIFELVKGKNLKLAFNPGSRQLKKGVNSFRNILAVSQIVFINKEEAEDIAYGSDQGIPEEKKTVELLLKEVKKMGPKIVSITDGDKGSYVIDESENIFYQEIIPATFVQKTGVGDAYSTGFMAGVIRGKSLQESMKFGAMEAASVIGFIGAQTGLLTKDKLFGESS